MNGKNGNNFKDGTKTESLLFGLFRCCTDIHVPPSPLSLSPFFPHHFTHGILCHIYFLSSSTPINEISKQSTKTLHKNFYIKYETF